MAIPDFQSIMMPLLRCYADGIEDNNSQDTELAMLASERKS